MKDIEYLEVLLSPLQATMGYRPKLGQGTQKAISADEFQALYQADAFYRWLGLDLPEVYIAHRVAGGITSLYRQLGIGCERLLRRIFMDVLGLTEADLRWSYVVREGKQSHRIQLDAHILLERIAAPDIRYRLTNWIDAQRKIHSVTAELGGVVFEIRQGYKSKDSKRQNADLLSGSRAYQNKLLPCMLVLSQQIDAEVKQRYENGGWVVLIGTLESDTAHSTYAFLREVIGYDLAAFLERHQEEIRRRVHAVIQSLLHGEEG
ncbi:MAG: hypothetical protein N2554_03165 [Fimbriimonadales bacterium]|nr:hypothetical protein [Fimbriimonadales bacterium]